MIDVFDKFKERVEDLSGLPLAFARQIFEAQRMPGADELRSDTSPYKYIRYRDTNPKLKALSDRVYDLAKSETVHGSFGLTVKDLFGMDYVSFTELEDRILAMDQAKEGVMKDELNNLKTMKKEKQHGT